MVQVLIVDQSDVRLDYCDEDFIEEQELVGKLVESRFSRYLIPTLTIMFIVIILITANKVTQDAR